jgi:hypothetical protein
MYLRDLVSHRSHTAKVLAAGLSVAFLRLVPPSEGCRLPLIIGLLPLPVDPIQRW